MPDNILYFLGVSVALTVAPGPDVLFLAAQGVAGGPRAGLAVALGLSSGLLVHTALATLGVSAVFAASPAAFTALKLAGTAYLLWLAWGAFREKPGRRSGAENFSGELALYRRGVIMNLLNPKVALFFLALLPQFVDPAQGHVLAQSVTLGLIDEAGAPTILGKYLYSALDLGSISGPIRAYMWPSDLQTTAAAALAAQRMANMVETGDA